ncbi:MAG: YihY/virulence factor BrkB family protein, partial [Pseudonocardiaceae bacterium]
TSTGLRVYISSLTGSGYTYGALAAPIAYLLFCFFIAMAIVLGAEFNSAIEELWPAQPTRRDRRRGRRRAMDRLAERDLPGERAVPQRPPDQDSQRPAPSSAEPSNPPSA